METPRQHIDRVNREAEAERGPADPRATRPRDTRWLIGIVSACLVAALVLLGFMFFGNEHYVAPPAPGIEKPGIANQR